MREDNIKLLLQKGIRAYFYRDEYLRNKAKYAKIQAIIPATALGSPIPIPTPRSILSLSDNPVVLVVDMDLLVGEEVLNETG